MKVVLGDVTVVLEHVEWELRDMPQARHNGPYIPRSNMYHGKDGRLYIRVDLPGFKESDRRKQEDFPAESESEKFHWWGVSVDKQPKHRSILVTGHRQRPSGFQEDDGTDQDHGGQSFGLFRLWFPILDLRLNHDDSDLTVEFEDATLKIITSRREEAEL
jgi:hypothetical protein